MNTKFISNYLKDTKYPIYPIEDEGYLRYALTRCGALEDYDAFTTAVERDFNSNGEQWSAFFGGTRNRIIEDIKKSEKYIEFGSCDMTKYILPAEGSSVGGKGIYLFPYIGGVYLSVDLGKANFQTFRYLGIHTESSWEEFIDKYTDNHWISGSKQFRATLYGNLNPKRTMSVEKYLIWGIHELLGLSCPLVSIVNDELIYKVDNPEAIHTPEIINLVKKELGLDIRAEIFRLGSHLLGTSARKKQIRFYEKQNLETGEKTYHCLPGLYYLIAMNLLEGKEVCEYDKWFINDGILCKVEDDLRLIEE